ncbi:hypothetical protein [Roseateles saccharophilus]|uniref:hypothetical protein n=1 Tax=Roseateles saccharophilus TaxID=304 RepID=UPI00104F0A62|nr:hypothetical protein [Roseateles saccharophilus]MDG0832887.1 hypothetical protein [Roseateles saccharophilus]
MAVCTGAFILGRAGLLGGQAATTTAGANPQLAKLFPKAHVVTDRRYVDSGRILTTGGLSAGIDGALHVVDRDVGRLRAQSVACFIEYEWRADGAGGSGQLATHRMPDLTELLQASASWLRVVDQGDARQWEISGRLEIRTSPDQFLDAAAATAGAQAWAVQSDGAKLRRSFVKTQGGASWRFSLSLDQEAGPGEYRLKMHIQQVPRT